MSNNIICNSCNKNIGFDEIGGIIENPCRNREVFCVDCVEEFNDNINNIDNYKNCSNCDLRCPYLINGICSDCSISYSLENNLICERCYYNDHEVVQSDEGCKLCINCNYEKIFYRYAPIIIEIKNVISSPEVEECCVCLEDKYCNTGYFKCNHSVCGICHYKLNNVICPLCRAEEMKNLINPISELIILFEKRYGRYPWSEYFEKKIKKTTKLNAFAQFAFTYIRCHQE